MDTNYIIKEAITTILNEFVNTPDGDKQCFDIYETEAYTELEEAGLTNCDEIRHLTIHINNIVNSWEGLCDEFGDMF